MIEVIVYSRDDCHLCEDVLQELHSLQEEIPHEVRIVNIESDPKLLKQYKELIPVVVIGPYTLKPPIVRQDLEITLKAAQRRAEQITTIDQAIETGQLSVKIPWSKADGFSYWLSRHYLALFNLIVFVYVGLPFLAPVLMKVGAAAPGELIYRAYGAMCHQMAFRSFFLFGEQAAYPRAAAHVAGLIPYGQATGLSEGDILAARAFLGNSLLGFKVALCERDVAIYGGILLFGLLFALLNKSVPRLPWYLWILIGVAPIALDGVSQLISQPPFAFLPYRESTPFLRVLTGGLFGIMTAWFGYPMFEESMRDTREYMETKLRRIARQRQVQSQTMDLN